MTYDNANQTSPDPQIYGLDVHSATIVISKAPRLGPPEYVKTIPNNTKAIKAFFKPELEKGAIIHTVYEAGGCGYALDHLLKKLGIHNVVCAPSKIVRARGSKIKNDKVDANLLARLLRSEVLFGHKELHHVFVPEVMDEAIREYCRRRDTLQSEVKKVKNQILSLLRRHGAQYDKTKSNWTITHRSWLATVDLGFWLIRQTLDEYIEDLSRLEKRVAEADKTLIKLRGMWRKAVIAQAISCLRGFSDLTSIALVAEIGSFARFEKAPDLMAYIGLTPSEFSSGNNVTRGRITKTGNKKVRTICIEAANHARKSVRPRTKIAKQAPKGVHQDIINRAYECEKRMFHKYWLMVNKGKNTNKAKTAVARELLGFIWNIGLMAETLLDAGEPEPEKEVA